MKITAEFDSVNSADLAASYIRKTVSPFSDIRVIQSHSKQTISLSGLTAAFGNGNPSIGPNMYTYPIPYTNSTDQDMEESYCRNKVTLEVTCRKEDRKKVSGVIINGGGFGIREYN